MKQRDDVKSETDRIAWLDYAKGIGIILVVYGHVLVGLKGARIGLSEHFFYFSHNIVYSFHMPLFFFLAGLNVSRSLIERGAIGFIVNKLLVIMYPYMIWSLLTGGLQIIFSRYINSSITPLDLLRIWYCPLPDQHYWFLFTLFMMYMVCAIFNRMTPRLSFYLLTVLAIFLYFAEIRTSVRVIDKLSLNIIFFVLGIAYQRYRLDKFIPQKSSLFIMLMSSCIFLVYEFLSWKTSVDLFPALKLTLALSGIIVTLMVSRYLAVSNALMTIKMFGFYSLHIYLVHGLVLASVRIFLQKICGIQLLSVHIFLGLIIGILLPIIIYKLALQFHVPHLFEIPQRFSRRIWEA